MRDEAHRFAITYHQKLRGRARLRSPLDDVPGIGAGRRRALLRHFGSVARIRAATTAEIAQTPGIGIALAMEIKRALGGEPVAAAHDAGAVPGEAAGGEPRD